MHAHEDLSGAPLGLLLARVLGEQHQPIDVDEATRAVRSTKAPRSAVKETLEAMVRDGFAQGVRGKYATAGLSFPEEEQPQYVHPTKPIVIARHGRGFTLYVSGVPLVDGPDGKLAFTEQPGAMKRKRTSYAPATSPVHVFEKIDDAKGAAHQIGRYMMDLGDMVFSYTELPARSRW